MTYEIPPSPKEPDFSRCLLVSDAVLRQLEKPGTMQAGEWHHLSETIWSEVPAVQAMALRILRHLAPSEPWARDLIEESYPEPEVEDLANEASL